MWQLNTLLSNAPADARELRLDRNGKVYWCNKSSTWTKGVFGGDYSSLRSDLILATLTTEN